MSLDIVLGACIGSLFFARLLAVSLPPLVIYILGTAVWLIYTTDRLSDARRIKTEALTERHAFHQKYAKKILPFALFFIVSDLIILFFLPTSVVRAGLLLGAAVLLYFIMMNLLPQLFMYLKELSAAFLYTAGVCLPALSLYSQVLSTFFIWGAVGFFLVVLANLLSFSYADYQVDYVEKHASLAVSVGKKSVLWLLRAIAIIFLLLGLLGCLYAPALFHSPEIIILVLMMVPFAIAATFPKIMEQTKLFRAIGDSVFMFPAVILIFY